MQLRLTVRGPAGSRDVVVTAHPTATVRELARVLAGLAPDGRASPGGGPVDLLARAAARRGDAPAVDGSTPALHRKGALLDPTARVGGSGLLDGDVVHLLPAGSSTAGAPGAVTPDQPSRGASAYEVHVLSGPDEGLVHLLPAGASVLGRGALAEVTLTDPTVDREHAVVHVGAGGVRVQDLGGGATLGGEPVETSEADTAVGTPGASSAVKVGGSRRRRKKSDVESTTASAVPDDAAPEDRVLTLGRTRLLLRPAGEPDAAVVADGAGGLAYNRPPRIRPAGAAQRITMPTEPKAGEGPRFKLIAILAPVAFGVVLAVVLQQPRYLIFTALSPVMVLGNYLSDRRHDRRKTKREAAEHTAALASARERVDRALDSERSTLLAAAPGPSELLLLATGPRGRLWERRAGDEDALALRIGLATLPSQVTVVDRDAPDDAPPLVQEQLPVVLPLGELGVVGVAGPPRAVAGTARWLLGQLAVLHSPRDVRVVVLHADGRAAAPHWDWLRWLPHARSGEDPRSPQLVGSDESSTAARVGELAALVTARVRARRDVRPGEKLALGEQVVVVLDGARELRALPGVPQMLQDGPAVGVHALCLAELERLLPQECRAVVLHEPSERCVVRSAAAVHDDVRADSVSIAWATQAARALAPLRDTSRQDDDDALPTALRLLDELHLDPPTAGSVAAGWSRGGRTTRALLGRSSEGPFAVDLVGDGPHALVAGTTGAGKSELLQTLIASLAVANRPDALTFVLVDYKGGSAFRDCSRLPHTVGMVTDLDGHLTERALASLGAELKRRESVLAASGSKDVEDHWAAGAPGDPMPRLVLVIDEFASLVEELPDFVRGLVGIAQRGRSLGVHLVLATQRPSGVVSPEIRANTNLRIALRVTDPTESNDVLDAPDAARVSASTPGRGYVRTGHASLTAFQAARVGGHRPGATGESAPQVLEVTYERLGHPLPLLAESAVEDDERTDLAELVTAVRGAAERTRLAAVAPPWLPPLPDELTLASLQRADGLRIPFGLADRPGEQRQDPAVLDLERGSHLLLSGAPRSGRSTVLRTLAGSMAGQVSCEDAHLYGIDCGNGALLPLMALPHVGAIVTRDQPERLTRLLDRLFAELSRRTELLAMEGYADLVEQRAASAPTDRLPYLVLLLDRWEGFVSAFSELDGGRLVDSLLRLLREGAAVGLRVVLAADRSGLVGKLSGAVEDRAVLRLADRADYGLVGMPARSVPDHIPPGRLFRGDDLVETQVALLTDDPSGPAQVAALQAIALRATDRDAAVPPARRPFRVDALPSRYTLSEASRLPSTHAAPTATTVLVGVGGDELSRVELDVAAIGPSFVVGGPPRSGRSTALLVMAGSALERGAQLLVVLPRRSPLAVLEGTPGVLGVLPTSTPSAELTATLADASGPVLLVVDDAELLGDTPVVEALSAFLRTVRDGGGAVLVSGTTEDLANSYRGFAVEARKSRLGLLLAPTSSLDGELLGVKLPRSTGGAVPVGRGLLVVGGEVTAVQVPRPD